MADNTWVRDELAKQGYTQRHLAQTWGISESAVSRWMSGQESQDLPISRGRSLSRMLKLSLDELTDRLGFGVDGYIPPPLPALVPADIKPGTINALPLGDGRSRITLYIDVPTSVASTILRAATSGMDAI